MYKKKVFEYNFYYILVDKIPQKATLFEWAEWFQNANRTVANDFVNRIYISTIFLGINQTYSADRPPQLFETRIFGGEHDGYQELYSTYKGAEAGHRRAVKKVKDSVKRSSDLL